MVEAHGTSLKERRMRYAKHILLAALMAFCLAPSAAKANGHYYYGGSGYHGGGGHGGGGHDHGGSSFGLSFGYAGGGYSVGLGYSSGGYYPHYYPSYTYFGPAVYYPPAYCAPTYYAAPGPYYGGYYGSYYAPHPYYYPAASLSRTPYYGGPVYRNTRVYFRDDYYH
jgi:hypothetical protein